MKFILGEKIEMTQKFAEDGAVVPVTMVSCGPCVITQVKTLAKDGYQAVQIGFGEKKKIGKSLKGHLKNLASFRYLKEVCLPNQEKDFVRGQRFEVNIFRPGDLVQVTARSKGKGFQGVVKRHGFHGSPASHGHKDQLRMPGSIGATDSARVFKGTRMAGRMGAEQVTVKNLEIVAVDSQNNLLFIKGAVPGRRGSLVMISGAGEMIIVREEEKKEPKKVTTVPSAEENKSPESSTQN